MLYKTDVINDVYDYIFDNTCKENINFSKEFPNSFVDYTNAKIYLCNEQGEQFILSLERV